MRTDQERLKRKELDWAVKCNMYSAQDDVIYDEMREMHLDAMEKGFEWEVYKRQGIQDNLAYKAAQIRFEESRARREEYQKLLKAMKDK